MNLETIAANPESSLTYMERYVNDGSPSGFTFLNTTSAETCPRSPVASFRLAEVSPRPGVLVRELGHIPSDLFSTDAGGPGKMFVHPDMLRHPTLLSFSEPNGGQSWFNVEPWSSARTVKIIGLSPGGFLKLHYEHHLGRILRRITLKHAQAALETDSILAELVQSRRMPATFAYYREVGARVFEFDQNGKNTNWGMIWRPAQICGERAHEIAYLLPAFSLFSLDHRHTDSNTLLQQLGEVHADSKITFLLEELLLPLVQSYFAMLSLGGLQGEWHAQNVLFGFDKSWHCVATVLRDMESVDRDLPMIARTGHSMIFDSYPYKCLDGNQYNYAIRHSFMFDHKLGEYLLAPLIDHACDLWEVAPPSVDLVVTDFVMSQLDPLPPDFFPVDGYWYKFANELIDQDVDRRPYVRLGNPRFRFGVRRGSRRMHR